MNPLTEHGIEWSGLAMPPRQEKREPVPSEIADVVTDCRVIVHQHAREWIRLSDGLRLGVEPY